MKTRIHINQHNIRANKGGKGLPVVTVKDYKQNRRTDEAVIIYDGKEVARIVYRPDHPLSCGAKCWVETDCEVVVE